jgi:hypothetical protein
MRKSRKGKKEKPWEKAIRIMGDKRVCKGDSPRGVPPMYC